MSAASTADPLVPLQERIAKIECQANILSGHGDPEGALALYKEAERLSRELEDKWVLLRVLGNQANILRSGD